MRSHNLLMSQAARFRHALVMLDRDGCGKEQASREELEAEIEQRLSQSGWGDRAAAVVLDPELEIWVWSDSPHVAEILGWTRGQSDLLEWLAEKGFPADQAGKPRTPKEAMEKVLRSVRKSRSSSLFSQLAEKVSVNRCTDAAFIKFKTTLHAWFGASD